jgi:threonine dehydrogenase-like Zn-dependent dehydrogenase
MRAAVWNRDGALDVEDRPTPEPRPGWLRVRVAATGICGTDLHFFRGSFPSPAGLIPGHEVAGAVDAVGEGVAIQPDTPVAVEPLLGCGQCAQCASGHTNRCAQRTLFGVTTRGGMAEYMTIPEAGAWPVPAGLDTRDGVLAEPIAVCVRGFRLADIAAGDRVAIIGAGSIGLICIAAAQAAGAAEVQCSARHDFQRAQAVALGAAPLAGYDFDVVVETVGGHSDALHEAMGRARPGGTVVVLGIYDDLVPFSAYDLSLKELRLVGSNCYSHVGGHRDFAAALDLLADRHDDLVPLVTHEFALDQVNDAFATAADKSTGSIKVLVRP